MLSEFNLVSVFVFFGVGGMTRRKIVCSLRMSVRNVTKILTKHALGFHFVHIFTKSILM